MGLFRGIRVIAGGQVSEDLDYYNRLHQLVDLLVPSDRRRHTLLEGLGREDNESTGENSIYRGDEEGVFKTP